MFVWKKLFPWLAMLVLLLGIAPVSLAEEQAPYTALAADDGIVRESPDRTAKIVTRIPAGKSMEILAVEPEWVKVRYSGKTGYLVRTQIHKVTPIDPVNTPPYGVVKHTYMAVTADVTPVLVEPKAGAEAKVTLQAGARLSILDITDGWARIPYWRQYAYVDTRLLKDLTPVSPTDTPVSGETPIAAFTSFYSVANTESNIGRMNNIAVACKRLSRVIEPGQTLDFNRDIGPYNRKVGYMEAPVLINGKSQPGYGGGTCQVSSTFYNALLQLPGISILYRRPHGPAGAKYLPHGVDAAVGNDNLNLIIRNDYDFTIRIDASAQDGALFVSIYKQ